jgi:hypothetical protein
MTGPLITAQGWNKMWDEWVEQTGLTKFKKELAAMEFQADGKGGPPEGAGGGAAAAAANGGGKASGRKRKADEADAHANGSSMAAAQVGNGVTTAVLEHAGQRSKQTGLFALNTSHAKNPCMHAIPSKMQLLAAPEVRPACLLASEAAVRHASCVTSLAVSLAAAAGLKK